MKNLIEKVLIADSSNVDDKVKAAYAELAHVEGLRDFRQVESNGWITVVMTNHPTVIETIEGLNDANIEWCAYSGRGMFGKHTIGVHCGRDLSEGDVYRATKAKFQIDQLGKGTVLYLHW